MMETLPDIAIAMNSLAENAVLQQGGGPSIEQGRPLHSVSVSQRSAQGMRSAESVPQSSARSPKTPSRQVSGSS